MHRNASPLPMHGLSTYALHVLYPLSSIPTATALTDKAAVYSCRPRTRHPLMAAESPFRGGHVSFRLTRVMTSRER